MQLGQVLAEAIAYQGRVLLKSFQTLNSSDMSIESLPLVLLSVTHSDGQRGKRGVS